MINSLKTETVAFLVHICYWLKNKLLEQNYPLWPAYVHLSFAKKEREKEELSVTIFY